ncbi:hypothetical protein K1719_036531 [Acacia pycnantha]|nr:hypothetical protein K1719_036531 [Acacia pycnantha]
MPSERLSEPNPTPYLEDEDEYPTKVTGWRARERLSKEPNPTPYLEDEDEYPTKLRGWRARERLSKALNLASGSGGPRIEKKDKQHA